MSITHTFISSKSDGGDSTLVKPSDWNADHTIADGYALMRVKVVPLSNNDIIHLPSFPVEIIPAPGMGKANVLITAFINPNITVGYTGVDTDGNYIGMDYGNDLLEPTNMIVNDTASTTTDLSDLLSNTSNPRFQIFPHHKIEPLLTWTTRPIILGAPGGVDIEDLPMYLFCYNGAGDFSSGDPANTITVTALYYVADL